MGGAGREETGWYSSAWCVQGEARSDLLVGGSSWERGGMRQMRREESAEAGGEGSKAPQQAERVYKAASLGVEVGPNRAHCGVLWKLGELCSIR